MPVSSLWILAECLFIRHSRISREYQATVGFGTSGPAFEGRLRGMTRRRRRSSRAPASSRTEPSGVGATNNHSRALNRPCVLIRSRDHARAAQENFASRAGYPWSRDIRRSPPLRVFVEPLRRSKGCCPGASRGAYWPNIGQKDIGQHRAVSYHIDLIGLPYRIRIDGAAVSERGSIGTQARIACK